MALTDLKSKTAKPKTKPYKLFDAEGLYLYVPPSGRKVWRFKYRFNGKECLVTIGKFPNKTLKEARKARNQYLLMLDEGKNPAEVKRLKKNPEGMSFKEVAQEWIDYKSILHTKRCWKPTHTKAVLKSLDNDVFPTIGSRVISTLTPYDIDYIIDSVVKRGALEVAERILSRINSVFRYGIHKGYCSDNLALKHGSMQNKMVGLTGTWVAYQRHTCFL